MPQKTDRKDTVDIHEFSLKNINPVSKIVIVGKPASGKSVLIKDMVKAFRGTFPVAKVFSGTEENNHFYASIFPDLFIHPEYDEKEMENFAKRQKLVMRENPEHSKGLIIIDDCSDDPKFFNRPLFQKFYKNGRQWDMMFILALQYCKDIRPVIRGLIDYTFIFRESIELNRQSIYKNYASIIGSYQDFCDMMDQVAEDYTAIVIDNRKQSNNLTDCVFYYKAPFDKNDEFTFGCTEYKQWAEQRFDPKYIAPI